MALYDGVLAELSDVPSKITRGPRASAEARGQAHEDLGPVDPQEREAALKTLADQSLRCAKLIERALDVADRFKHVDERVLAAHRSSSSRGSHSEGDNEEEDDDGDSESGAGTVKATDDDGSTAQLLEELIAANDLVQHTATTVRAMGLRTAASTHVNSRGPRSLESSADDDFQNLYMEEFTSAFGDELDQFRQEDCFESKDVLYLISCIKAGSTTG